MEIGSKDNQYPIDIHEHACTHSEVSGIEIYVRDIYPKPTFKMLIIKSITYC